MYVCMYVYKTFFEVKEFKPPKQQVPLPLVEGTLLLKYGKIMLPLLDVTMTTIYIYIYYNIVRS